MIWRKKFLLRCFKAWETVSFTYTYMFRNPIYHSDTCSKRRSKYFCILEVQPFQTISLVSYLGPSPLKAGDYDASVPAAITSDLRSLFNHRFGVDLQALSRSIIILNMNSEL